MLKCRHKILLMPNFSKSPNIEAVLAKAAKTLDEIQSQYSQALNAKDVSEKLLLEIKDYLGNLKSALDYLNCQLQGSLSGSYFPICDHPNDFEQRVINMPDKIKKVLATWQPYAAQTWLKDFNELNNKNKHVTLTPQKRYESIETRVTAPNGGAVHYTGVTFGPGVSVLGVPIDPATQMPVPNNIVKTERITWVDFRFENTGELSKLSAPLSALPFLILCLKNITSIVKEVEDVV